MHFVPLFYSPLLFSSFFFSYSLPSANGVNEWIPRTCRCNVLQSSALVAMRDLWFFCVGWKLSLQLTNAAVDRQAQVVDVQAAGAGQAQEKEKGRGEVEEKKKGSGRESKPKAAKGNWNGFGPLLVLTTGACLCSFVPRMAPQACLLGNSDSLRRWEPLTGYV